MSIRIIFEKGGEEIHPLRKEEVKQRCEEVSDYITLVKRAFGHALSESTATDLRRRTRNITQSLVGIDEALGKHLEMIEKKREEAKEEEAKEVAALFSAERPGNILEAIRIALPLAHPDLDPRSVRGIDAGYYGGEYFITAVSSDFEKAIQMSIGYNSCDDPIGLGSTEPLLQAVEVMDLLKSAEEV